MIPLPGPLVILGWLKDNWLLFVVLALVAAIGVQTYRLQGAQAERDVLALEKTERGRRDAMRDMANHRNQERTDEEYVAAQRRAALAKLRRPATGDERIPTIDLAGSGDGPTICFDRGRLNSELAGWVRRTVDRATALYERHGERLDGVAEAGEGVSAAYRSCRAWALNLTETEPPLYSSADKY